MAAHKKVLCSVCGREPGQVTCEGCSKTFCLPHFTEHRQHLETRLDEVQISRDTFRQELTESTTNHQNHILMQQINSWENKSHNRIKQAADEARQTLTQHLDKFTADLETRLKTLTEQLCASRNKNDFNEFDLDGWSAKLSKMVYELKNSPDIKITNKDEVLLTKIKINIIETPSKTKFHERESIIKSTVTSCEPNDSLDQAITCSFCNANVPSAEIGYHFLQCGNKTEQCAKCKQFVRRAVFAYHCGNNCAPDPDACTPVPDIPKPTIAITCEYCQQRCLTCNYKEHKENCLQNPRNQWRFSAKNSRKPSNDSDENAGIPCEWCTKLIPFEHYQRHTETCRNREHKKLLEKHREQELASIPAGRVSNIPLALDTAKCIYCKKVMPATGITYHQLVCVKNLKRNKN